MTAGTALIALKPPAIDKPMLVALTTRTPEPIGPASLLQSSYCYAEAQGLHIAPRCRRAAGTQAGRGLSGNGWHCATWPAWYMRISLSAQPVLRGASWVIKCRFALLAPPQFAAWQPKDPANSSPTSGTTASLEWLKLVHWAPRAAAFLIVSI